MADWKREAKRGGHVIWAMVQALAAVALVVLAVKLFDQDRLLESPVGQVAQLSSHGTDSADLYLLGTIACIVGIALLVWGTVHHWRAGGR